MFRGFDWAFAELHSDSEADAAASLATIKCLIAHVGNWIRDKNHIRFSLLGVTLQHSKEIGILGLLIIYPSQLP
jgi:hypothetical protein